MTCILVVEDESIIREMLSDVLREAGFDTVTAVTADAAIPLLDQQKFGMIVTDINLPGKRDGIALALSARVFHPRMPVLFISGRPAKLAEAKTRVSPAAYLQKPFSFGHFLDSVQTLLNAAEIT